MVGKGTSPATSSLFKDNNLSITNEEDNQSDNSSTTKHYEYESTCACSQTVPTEMTSSAQEDIMHGDALDQQVPDVDQDMLQIGSWLEADSTRAVALTPNEPVSSSQASNISSTDLLGLTEETS